MNRVELNSKITASHLARKAVVYLRQSSIAQVKYNTESQRLQYALKDTAMAYGFARVEVIDCDLGMSASSGSRTRGGFKQLLAGIALGEVGMVLSREPSRLSRTDKDWCQLMELCRVLNTLIGDAESVYDLNRLDDQLILGIKGTLSVVELGTLKLRLQQGREAKAKRGELGRSPQPGYVMDEVTRRLVKDPKPCACKKPSRWSSVALRRWAAFDKRICGFTKSASSCRSINPMAGISDWFGNCPAKASWATC